MGMPTRAFLYTLDQVSEMVAVPLTGLRQSYIHFDRKTVGAQDRDKIMARNIAPPGATPEWRVAEAELVRWLKRKGFRIYDRAWVAS
jgi:hypothetical protein